MPDFQTSNYLQTGQPPAYDLQPVFLCGAGLRTKLLADRPDSILFAISSCRWSRPNLLLLGLCGIHIRLPASSAVDVTLLGLIEEIVLDHPGGVGIIAHYVSTDTDVSVGG